MERMKAFLMVGMCASMCMTCGAPGPKDEYPEDYGKTTDLCIGDQCGMVGDVEVVSDVLVKEKIGPDYLAEVEDVKGHEGAVCENECEEGQIKCDENPIYYYECEENKDGCWRFSASKVKCPKGEQCSCTEENAKGEKVCIPEDGQACKCFPNCEGKECGSDGCGGYCGNGNPATKGCEEGQICNLVEGTCGEVECNICEEGEQMCEENTGKVIYCVDFNADVPGELPCWSWATEAVDCPPFQECKYGEKDGVPYEGCLCKYLECNGECCESEDAICSLAGGQCCVPDCEGKECGDDGCGGKCPEKNKPDCGGKEPVCSNYAWTCEWTCPNECNEGDFVCKPGGEAYQECQEVEGHKGCWEWSPIKGCPAGTACSEELKTCVCMPNCAGKKCGDDGCGGVCGTGPYDGGCTGSKEKCIEGKCVCSCEGEPEAPLCDEANNKTYANECEAICALGDKGYAETVFTKGKCKSCMEKCTPEELKPQEYCSTGPIAPDQTFSSFCELKCIAGGPDCISPTSCPEIKHLGACKSKPGCSECVGKKYNPICGKTGDTYVTYENDCSFKSALDEPGCGGPEVEFVCYGACIDPEKYPACGNECDPVCGEMPNGKEITFMNPCIMEAAGAKLKHKKRCCVDASSEEDWVCAEDGGVLKAYQNPDLHSCLAEETSQILYHIPVQDDGTPWLAVCEVCSCHLEEYDPVCADDFHTYDNACALNCKGLEDPKSVPAPYCEGVECGWDTCPCPTATGGFVISGESTDPNDDGRRGVCGADGNTYGNACSAIYFGTTIKMKAWCADCAEVCAKQPYQPICCEDGVTYPSPCIPQKCNSVLDFSKCHKGKCCHEDADCDDGNPDTQDSCNLVGVCENL